MKYQDFLNNLRIERTNLGKGVRCNIVLYMFPDGNSNFYFKNGKGNWVIYNKKAVSMPSNNKLQTVERFKAL